MKEEELRKKLLWRFQEVCQNILVGRILQIKDEKERISKMIEYCLLPTLQSLEESINNRRGFKDKLTEALDTLLKVELNLFNKKFGIKEEENHETRPF